MRVVSGSTHHACGPLERAVVPRWWMRWLFALLIPPIGACLAASPASRPATSRSAPARFTFDRAGVTRGDQSKRELSLVFTGGDFGEGAPHILDVLKREPIKASFFVTGGYLRKPEHLPFLRRIIAEGHYLGPHSDAHLLYCPWEDRDRTLVTREEFKSDLARNIADLRKLGALRAGEPVYFIPPYEWYNAQHVAWAREMGVVLFNFSPGSGSNRDYVPEGDRKFVPSRRILEGILAWERKDPHGLSGFMLLLHLGADRADKMYLLLDPLVKELSARGYRFLRIDELLRGATTDTAPATRHP